MATICPICEGTGFRIARREDGMQFAENCICRVENRTRRLIGNARIPRRFENCSLEAYETTNPSSNSSLKKALNTARHFIEGYPLETKGKGLLFTGTKGLGKTHLAVSILRGLISERGASGVFWEHKELMECFRGAMFGDSSFGAENRILTSVLQSDVLVLDDLGDMTQSDWTWDTTSYILNSRYNAELSTIITTNFDNNAAMAPTTGPRDQFAEKRQTSTRTLGDRIGDRMWSRLQEMCVIVEMHGEDFRQKVKRASFA